MLRRLSALAMAVLLIVAAPASSSSDPEPGSPEWIERDLANVAASSGRLVDQHGNPAFHAAMAAATPGTFVGGVSDQLAHPGHPAVTLGQLVPGGRTADPFRLDWAQQGRGVATPIDYRNRYGARITGTMWAPALPFTDPVTGTTSDGPFPTAVITTGSIQGFEEMYLWAAQGLAEAGIDIDAVVAWDNANLGADQEPRVPTMGQSADYFFSPAPSPTSRPDPEADTATYRRFVEAGVDAMQVVLGSSTHLEWTYIPYILPASSEGERVAMHCTLAWTDRYVKADLDVARGPARRDARTITADATARLTATVFDDSADASAIGAGTWDPATATNVPHTIADEDVSDHLSIYHRSAYAFDAHRCDDMRAGC